MAQLGGVCILWQLLHEQLPIGRGAAPQNGRHQLFRTTCSTSNANLKEIQISPLGETIPYAGVCVRANELMLLASAQTHDPSHRIR